MKPTILLVGTDHFSDQANGNLFNTNKVDVLSQERQNEMREIIHCLKQFEPTKVALEVIQENEEELNAQYASYLNGNYPLTVNEIDQIGFRLAGECHLNHVYAVDWNEEQRDIPNSDDGKNSVMFKEVMRLGERIMAESNTYLHNHTLKDYLLWLNESENVSRGQEFYMKLALVEKDGDPVGATWTAKYWYYRNLLIYKNLVSLIESEEERIFVLYGSGHLHLLLEFLKESGMFDVKVASDYLI
ncbi:MULTISPECIES: DUF5694 domain-containing protein [Pontibacillus]|uniref:DUF5694 domain-containing protein n=1 Tax=Pontibacillus chungwhensis TaxID=265426 RepID=A0ABY8V0X3_9BACI|nr:MULTISPECIES: DUF5694 domain-containing protein [Pontibacillus]MCD5324416.1 DUF5694 domain-containing protein [Pontibacillus sp. HN14]WIF99288.1 DUF5694 domain-containing protein [Pontibacillus chungwhensis]